MLPTTYRGDAIIDGERIEAILNLNSDSIRLELEGNQEILRWDIGSLHIQSLDSGVYEMGDGSHTFTFQPAADDGLEDEITLRRRLHDGQLSPSTNASPSPDTPAVPTPRESPTIAERVAAAGRDPTSSRRFPGIPAINRSSLAVGLMLTGAVLTTVISGAVFGASGSRTTVSPTAAQSAAATASTAPDQAIDPEPTPTTVPLTSIPADRAPTPTTAPVASSVPPPTVADVTVTTAPPSVETGLPTDSIFGLSPVELAERWDMVAHPYLSTLVSGDLRESDSDFSFSAGPFVRLQGSTDGELVSRIAFVGDPSGTVTDDRQVLTALGLLLSVIEPTLTPDGRRELLWTLGLDVEEPELAGLDDTLEYRGRTYWLRWDTELERLVLDVRPVNEDAGGS